MGMNAARRSVGVVQTCSRSWPQAAPASGLRDLGRRGISAGDRRVGGMGEAPDFSASMGLMKGRKAGTVSQMTRLCRCFSRRRRGQVVGAHLMLESNTKASGAEHVEEER